MGLSLMIQLEDAAYQRDVGKMVELEQNWYGNLSANRLRQDRLLRNGWLGSAFAAAAVKRRQNFQCGSWVRQAVGANEAPRRPGSPKKIGCSGGTQEHPKG